MYSQSAVLCNSIATDAASRCATLITSIARETVMANIGRVLVLGATGGIGGEVSRQLRDAGWEVRALKRAAANANERKDGITWLRGDALNREDVAAAAQGCSVIVHAVSPPGYRR